MGNKRSEPAMPPRLRPRKAPLQARSRSTVDAMVEAASRVLVERRWAGFSMQEVAAVAGVSPGSLYQYFADKDALIAELIERISAREVAFQRERIAAASAASTLEAAVQALLAGTLEFQRHEGPAMRAALECIGQMGRHDALVDRVRQVTVEFRGMLQRHCTSISRPDLDTAVYLLVNALHAVTHEGALPRPPALDDATLEREAVALVLGYLRG